MTGSEEPWLLANDTHNPSTSERVLTFDIASCCFIPNFIPSKIWKDIPKSSIWVTTPPIEENLSGYRLVACKPINFFFFKKDTKQQGGEGEIVSPFHSFIFFPKTVMTVSSKILILKLQIHTFKFAWRWLLCSKIGCKTNEWRKSKWLPPLDHKNVPPF